LIHSLAQLHTKTLVIAENIDKPAPCKLLVVPSTVPVPVPVCAQIKSIKILKP